MNKKIKAYLAALKKDKTSNSAKKLYEIATRVLPSAKTKLRKTKKSDLKEGTLLWTIFPWACLIGMEYLNICMGWQIVEKSPGGNNRCVVHCNRYLGDHTYVEVKASEKNKKGVITFEDLIAKIHKNHDKVISKLST